MVAETQLRAGRRRGPSGRTGSALWCINIMTVVASHRDVWRGQPLLRTRRHRWIVAITAISVVLLVMIPSMITFASWRTAVWWTNPSGVHWCGRDYSNSHRYVQQSQIAPETLLDDAVFPLKRIGYFPPWSHKEVMARVTPPQWKAYTAGSGIACAGAL